jgi:hypothetical protein
LRNRFVWNRCNPDPIADPSNGVSKSVQNAHFII